MLVEVDHKRVSAADPYPAPINRPPVDAEKPFDTSPLQIGIGNAADLFLGQHLEIKTSSRSCRQNCATRFRWRFAQQGGKNGRSPGAIFHSGKVDVLYETLDDRSDGHDHNHRDENDCRKLPAHGLGQKTADETPHASSTVAVKM
ncbi:hypothetical protein [Mesorhizobium sp. M7D.F.Ca.US.004.03.1.1]|uniref:hypothetical protein n=1 Tax=Mesorhizobium sp. M7D.F.Ca.US.004.03.1.1 TaxID=2496702 RepID=UPI001FE1CDA1|nr:hypothetical protein [Mesorhizobium sp. M7D.F.Ca.US.004.03.1.1]